MNGIPEALRGFHRPWHDRAACAGLMDDTFFPGRGGRAADAKRICNTCPVLDLCRADAHQRDERWGIWGGQCEAERRRELNGKKRRPWKPPTPADQLAAQDARIGQLAAAGLTNPEIAARLDVCTRTVERARARNRAQQQEAA